MLMHSGAVAEEFSQDFREGRFNEHTLTVLGSAQHLRRENEGLRITFAESSDDPSNAGVVYPLHLVGDCAFQATVELIDVPTPAGGYGTGVAILLEDGIEFGASLQLVRNSNGKLEYVAHHFMVDEVGRFQHKGKTHAADDGKAVLQLRREDSTLKYYVSEDDGSTFQQIHEIDFTDRPLTTVRVFGQPGGEPNVLDLRLLDMQVAAERIVRPGKTTRPPGESRLSWWMAAILFVSLPTILILLWRYRRSSNR